MFSSLQSYGWMEVSIFVNLHQSLFIISGFSPVSVRRHTRPHIVALIRSLARLPPPRRYHSFVHSFIHFQAQFNLATVGQFLPCSLFPSQQPSPPPPSPSWNNTRPSQSINFTNANGIAIVIVIPTPIDDKNKGVVDRSSTVVARDVLERAAAANEGNYSASPSCSWQQSAGGGAAGGTAGCRHAGQ